MQPKARVRIVRVGREVARVFCSCHVIFLLNRFNKKIKTNKTRKWQRIVSDCVEAKVSLPLLISACVFQYSRKMSPKSKIADFLYTKRDCI